LSLRQLYQQTDVSRFLLSKRKASQPLVQLQQDHLHFDYMKFKGAACLRYDGIFPIEKTPSSNFAYFILKGYLCPNANAKDSAIQMEFSNYSNTRGLTEDLHSLSDEFFEKITFYKAAVKTKRPPIKWRA
jgi:hypothetical protein